MNGITILLIDRDAASRNYVAAFLRQQGYVVLAAASAKQGLVAAWTDRPALVIVDPAGGDLSGEELARKLRGQPSTAEIPLIALSSDTRPQRRRSCTEAGFAAFIIKSPTAMPALTERISDLLRAPGAQTRAGGSLIVFLSAKGGTGTSSLCANLATIMAAELPHASVAVADLVLPIGSIAEIVGYGGGQNLVSLGELPPSAMTPQFLRENLSRLPAWGFHLLAGSPDPKLGNELDVARVEDLVHGLQSTYDIVVIDLGRSLSRISLPLIERANLIVMIVGGDWSTVTLSRTVWEYLQGKGVQAARMYVISNRAVGLEGLTKAEAEQVIGLPIDAAVPYLAENLSLANNQHMPYTMKFPSDTASFVLKESARQMLERAAALQPV